MSTPPVPPRDSMRLFSLSYRGMSPRRELWLMLGLLLGSQALVHFTIGESGAPLIGLLYLLFFCPLLVRRARHMGAVWYGVLVILLPYLLIPAAMVLCMNYYSKQTAVAIALGLASLLILLHLPLLVCAGGSRRGCRRALALRPSAHPARQE